MGVACSMSNILQRPCGSGTVRNPPPPPPGCAFLHPDEFPGHDETWIADAFPPTWVHPITIDWGDGTVETASDGQDAHEYAAPGSYVVTVHDSSPTPFTCSTTVAAPHGA